MLPSLAYLFFVIARCKQHRVMPNILDFNNQVRARRGGKQPEPPLVFHRRINFVISPVWSAGEKYLLLRSCRRRVFAARIHNERRFCRRNLRRRQSRDRQVALLRLKTRSRPAGQQANHGQADENNTFKHKFLPVKLLFGWRTLVLNLYEFYGTRAQWNRGPPYRCSFALRTKP